MTEYDYSPEAYERYLATQQRISKWVATTEGYRNEYGNALTVPPSQSGSHYQPIGQQLNPAKPPLRSSQSQYFHPQSPLCSQSRLASSGRRSAADLHYQYLQHSSRNASPRPSAPFVLSQAQHPQTVSRHGSSTNLHAAHSQHRDTHTSKTSSTCVAPLHPQKLVVPSQYPSIVPEVHGQRLHHANVAHASQRSMKSASPLQNPPLRHRVSTPQLETTSRQAPPTCVVTIPPSEKPTYVFEPSGVVPSSGLVIVPSRGQNTSIVISPPGSQIQPRAYPQHANPAVVSSYSSLTTPQTSPSQAIYSPPTYVPVPVVIIERERRSKSAGSKKSKKTEKKEKRSRSKRRD